MNAFAIKLENDRIFREGSFPEMRSEFAEPAEPAPVQRSAAFRVSEHTLRTDTISAVLQFAGKRVCALNFANANFPGGAYILGGNAQEEALCRASLLFYTIRTVKRYYIRNQLHVLPDYTDGMIWSEGVPIIRDNHGNRLEQLVSCDFITCPAVNRTFAKFLFSKNKLDSTMQHRITQIIALAALKQPDILVLGAFGCGVFGNRRETVYRQFEQAINQYLPDTVRVIFADPHSR
ncbi:MAG: TIGR02452 family protein [Oscillospiraceae bacterium]|nr:TIGR02452 family protein [Oscillospiraceae bacterium]